MDTQNIIVEETAENEAALQQLNQKKGFVLPLTEDWWAVLISSIIIARVKMASCWAEKNRV